MTTATMTDDNPIHSALGVEPSGKARWLHLDDKVVGYLMPARQGYYEGLYGRDVYGVPNPCLSITGRAGRDSVLSAICRKLRLSDADLKRVTITEARP